MSNYSKPPFQRKPFGNKPFGSKSFGNKGGFDRGPREMFKADCAKCGNACEVPFRPNGAKPVYCNNCFVREDSRRRSLAAPRVRLLVPHSSLLLRSPVRNDQAFNDLKAELRVVNQNLERLIAIMTPAAIAPKAAKASKKNANATH